MWIEETLHRTPVLIQDIKSVSSREYQRLRLVCVTCQWAKSRVLEKTFVLLHLRGYCQLFLNWNCSFLILKKPSHFSTVICVL